jgi:hypothetical protein
VQTAVQYRTLPTQRYLFITVLFQAAVAAVTGVSWWVILKEKHSANAWGAAASVMFFAIFLRPIIFSLPTLRTHHVGALGLGIVGMVTFLGAGPPSRRDHHD